MVTFTVAVGLVTRAITGGDSDGNDVYTKTTTTVQGVFAPGGSTERLSGGDTVITQPTVYLPAPAPKAIDTVTVLGLDFEVDGDPADWSTPNPYTGTVPDLPIVVRLKRVSG